MSIGARNGRMRRRIAIALVGISFGTALLLGVGNWAAERWVEDDSLNRLLDGEIQHQVAIGGPPAPGNATATLRYFRPAISPPDAPNALSQLAPGAYERVIVDGHPYRARVRQVAPGDRAYVLFDLAPLEAREGHLVVAFSMGVLLLVILAWWISSWLSARVLEPLENLVGQIRALDPESRGVRLDMADASELGVIVQAVNGYVQRIDDLVERERAFAASASHELRTPLAIIAGAAEILSSGPSDSSRAVARIGRAVVQAREDLDALLALSRREAIRTDLLALEECLPVWAENHTAISSATVTWSLLPVRVHAPAGSFRIIFTNLLRNALWSAGSKGQIEVRLAPGMLRVLDNGDGIPERELPRIFEPGFSGRNGGTGMGLYIAHSLAAREGWSLNLTNRADARGVEAILRFSSGSKESAPGRRAVYPSPGDGADRNCAKSAAVGGRPPRHTE